MTHTDRQEAGNGEPGGADSNPARGPGAAPLPGDARRPVLVIVSGPPGSGKTTLARALARAMPCPLVSRDDINEGIFETFAHDLSVVGKDHVTRAAFDAFFQTIDVLLLSKATVVAEAAFQHRRWRLGLDSLKADADIRVVHCAVEPSLARRRVGERRRAQRERPDDPAARRAVLARRDRPGGGPVAGSFEAVSLAVPSLRVATADGYDPPIETILEFLRSGRGFGTDQRDG